MYRFNALYGTYTRLSQRLALLITAGVSTMECAYIFAFLAILGFPGFHATATAYVQWVSQTFIQLVMLSVLSVQQKIAADAQADHHQQMTALQKHHHRENKRMHAQHADDVASLHDKIDALTPKPRKKKSEPPA